MTVWENLLVGAHDRVRASVPSILARLPRVREAERRAADEAAAVLTFVGLWDERDRQANTLSYGHQRRLEIARALMTAPRLLLLDEPAAGMNETESRDLADLILKIRSAGVDVMLIEHDMDLLMSISDRIVVLDHGEVIGHGTPQEVRADPRVLEAYLGSAV
jgi:branched-chain amino acid transport system permease protein